MEFKVFLVLLIIFLEPIVGSNHCKFPAVFNFGDSNSDTGGLTAAFGKHLLPPPYGRTFFHASTGRFSDGRITIDFMAESLGLPYLSPYLDPIANYSHGANFATGGSTIGPQTLSYFACGLSPFYLDVQHAQFSHLLTKSQIVRKQQEVERSEVVPEERYFSEALYTFDIGQNDITAAFARNLTVEEMKSEVPRLVQQFSNVIKKLYNQGGRTFWIHNTGPLGCLTYFIDSNHPDTDETQVDEYGCLILYNDAAQYFNMKLKEAVLQLREELPHAAITYVDMYSVKYSLITQANKLGFENPFLVCCGHGGKYNFNRSCSCGSKKHVAVDPFVGVDQDNANKWIYEQATGGSLSDPIRVSGLDLCSDPSVRINWDGIHLTEAANKWIFDQIVDGLYSYPSVPLEFSCKRELFGNDIEPTREQK